MTETRSKSLSIVYNGTEIWEELKPYLQSFSYTPPFKMLSGTVPA